LDGTTKRNEARIRRKRLVKVFEVLSKDKFEEYFEIALKALKKRLMVRFGKCRLYILKEWLRIAAFSGDLEKD
jgi:hypothetical protein